MAGFLPTHASADTQSPVSARIVEQTVRAAYADVPVLIQIAKCESRFRQYDENGNLLYNEQGSSAVGVMQIMSSIHSDDARRLGFDIRTLEGNLGYARHLYEHQGTSPWNASAYCWS